MSRNRNAGLRKRCGCPRRNWAKCPHGWHLNYKPKGGSHYRLSIDREVGRHVETKTEAVAEAERIRTAIRSGTFRPKEDCRPDPRAIDAPLSIEQLGNTYFGEYISDKTGAPLSNDERLRWELVMRTEIERVSGASARFGTIPVRDITRHEIEAFRKAHLIPRSTTVTDRKGRAYSARRGGVAAVRGCLTRLRAFFAWAVDQDYIRATPFRKGGLAVKGLFVREHERERRLLPGEEERLFKAANLHLQALMIAALETGCRVGELLSLQWRQVRLDLNEIHLRAADTKARRPRHLPISQRLDALLGMRRHDSEGREFPPSAYVFGDETGARVKSVKTAWETARLRAHGFEVKREKNGRLTGECRRQLGRINLRFHDLRREAGSRFLEGGMAPNYVQKFLDHANISTTSRYLKVERQGMHAALKRYEETRGIRCTGVAQTAPASADSASHSDQQTASKSLQ
jgi:integrase